jgi:hypothetical protein
MKFTPVTSGLALGAINIVLAFLFYLMGPETYANYWLLALLFLVPLVLLIVFGVQARKQRGGYMSYKDAFVFLFLTCIVFTVISLGFNLLMFHVIDTDFMTQVKELSLEKTAEMMEGFGMQGEAIDKAVTEAEKSMDENMSTVGQIKGAFFGLIFWAVVSALGALIVKKNKPEFA